MKIIHLKNLKRDCVLVELPEGAINPVFSMGYITYKVPNYKNWVSEKTLANPVKFHRYLTKGESDQYKDAAHKMPNGDWKLLGHFPSLIEQDFEGFVHSEQVFMPENGLNDWPTVYKGYKDNVCKWSAYESFISAIEAEGFLFENPYGKKPIVSDFSYDYEKQELDLFKWEFAQEKVLDINRCYVFAGKEVTK